MAAYGYRSESSSDESVSDLESIEGYRFQPKQQGPTLQDAPKDKHGEENPRDAEMARRKTRGDEVDWCHCGKCRVDFLVHHNEYVCCQEAVATRHSGNYFCV